MSVLTYYGTSPQFVVNDEIDQGDALDYMPTHQELKSCGN